MTAAVLVVDKPHFLATIPRGQHIVETALVRLLLFVVRPGRRGAYQTLFRDRVVRKTYEAVAPHDPALQLPRTVRSRPTPGPDPPAQESGVPDPRGPALAADQLTAYT